MTHVLRARLSRPVDVRHQIGVHLWSRVPRPTWRGWADIVFWADFQLGIGNTDRCPPALSPPPPVVVRFVSSPAEPVPCTYIGVRVSCKRGLAATVPHFFAAPF